MKTTNKYSMGIPNKLSLLRIICAIAIAILFILWLKFSGPGLWNAMFITFVVGCFTDFLDGYISRKKNMVTKFGEIIDPIADKALINTAMLVIVAVTFLTKTWILMIVVFITMVIMLIRDIIVDAAKITLATNKKKVAASSWGKAKTILQMIAITTMFAVPAVSRFNISVNQLGWLFIIAAVASVISGYDYVIKAWKATK